MFRGDFLFLVSMDSAIFSSVMSSNLQDCAAERCWSHGVFGVICGEILSKRGVFRFVLCISDVFHVSVPNHACCFHNISYECCPLGAKLALNFVHHIFGVTSVFETGQTALARSIACKAWWRVDGRFSKCLRKCFCAFPGYAH